MQLSVELGGLDVLLQDLNTKRISKQLAIAIGKTVKSLEAEIKHSVVNYYSVSGAEVGRTLQGKSTSLQRRGKNVITGGLTYKYEAKPLSDFPIRESTVSTRSRFLVPKAGGFSMHKRTEAKSVAVAVRRGKYKTVVGQKGYGGYYHKGGTSKWAKIQGGRSSSFKTGIYERQQDSTWITEPIERAPVKPLFGPAVVDMIDTMLDYDPTVQYMINNLDLLIEEHISL